MEFFLNARSIRNTFIAATLLTAMTLPLLASAAAVSEISIRYDETRLEKPYGPEDLYNKMKYASRKLCGSTDIRIAGSLRNSIKNAECFDGTLDAAVQRVDNPALTALHTK